MAKKILVIDDESDIVQLLLKRLEMNHYTVIVAVNGKDGLEKALTEQPDLMIVDLEMPEMNGYTFLQECKRKPELVQIPYIVLSAHSKLEYPLKNQGIKYFTSKPFEINDLLKTIKSIIG